MPWSNQGNGGGGGPWKPGNQGPWGGGSGGGPTPPDLEDLLRRGQDRLRKVMPSGAFGGHGFILIGLAIVAIWLASGFYEVQPNEVGLNMVFGRYVGKTTSGLNYNWPFPIGEVEKPKVTDRSVIYVGSRDGTENSDLPEESLMLTGDMNIADVKFSVIWQIDPLRPEDYVFNVRNQRDTIKAVSESVMREIVGHTPIQTLLTDARKTIEPAAQQLIQQILEKYQAGVSIIQVQLQPVDPPPEVIAAFKDVTVSQQDRDTAVNQAQAYANNAVPVARGNAARIVQEAEAYREQTVAQAKGQASRFDQIYEQYKKAPALTRERMYLETMEGLFGGMNKIIVDPSAGQGVVPYLPLDTLNAAKSPTSAPATVGAAK
jgi:modulator of FtsH protease HflK